MNKVILMGRLTKDPGTRSTATGKEVCSFTLAVDRKFKQEGQPEADFFPVVAWQKTAEFCSKYFSKGQKIAVVGRLQNRTWEDNNGNKRSITEIVAEEVDFAGEKKGGSNWQGPEPGTYDADNDDELPF